MMNKRQLFLFWQFNGDNKSWCNQHCPYCHTAGTPVLMASFSWKPIEQVKIGDLVVGYKYEIFEGSTQHRWMSVPAKVTNVFHRMSEVVELKTDLVTTYCTPDHKWLTTKHGANGYRETNILNNDPIRFVSHPVAFVEDDDYKLGWLNGMLRGDACIRGYPDNPKTKYYFRLAVKDHEILERFGKYAKHGLKEYDFLNLRAIQSQKKAVHYRMKELASAWKQNEQFAKGFLAGIFDAEGTCNGGSIRIGNTDPQILQDITKSFRMLGFNPILENHAKSTPKVRIGSLPEMIRFFAITNPAVTRKRLKLFGRSPRHKGARFISRKPIGEHEVYNITTETGNYVANGLISKNCYGGLDKDYRHHWNGRIDDWEQAFERLNRDIYFVFSYGEAMGSHGFYECVDMIGRHPNWTLCIVTNLSFSPERLIRSRLGRERRVFMIPSFHPLGVPDRVQGWEKFKKHLLMLKQAEIPTHVMYLWYRPQIKWYPEYFEWLDRHDFRAGVRRFIYPRFPTIKKIPIVRNWPWFIGKGVLENYTEAERRYLYAYTCPKVTEYGLDLASSKGRLCTAGKDMILVKCDGTVALCADCWGRSFVLGNVFDENYKLSEELVQCPTHTCGGDYGMLHMVDERFGPLPPKLWNDTFISQVEGIPQASPVPYPHRGEMLKWLEALKRERVKAGN